ncbi:ABC transporter substrate-binding protein [Sphingomonas sp.]|uniref:ABC transporter substrate-binding protein n=1 Tax=Sphingomonas sp. TaxID=28214 RepID=UPI000DB4A2EC|nr:ABC transporter substrate-binding protein [Sphingomonas sp.]PZU06252.1 MAG: hopanoid biosynthesis protein HpnM [Sphingomonas sp.]
MRHSMIGMALACLISPLAPALSQAPASAPVQALSDGLIATMKAGKGAGQRGREAIIGPIVDRSFDLPLMTRLVVGSAWPGLSPQDQAALLAAFRKMTIAQYADNFDSWSGERIIVDPNDQARGTDRLVRTSLVASGGKPTAIAYRLRQSAGGWKIIDVFYRDAISQLATRRADFATVLQRGGAKALIQHIEALNAKTSG